ncbi:NUDIX domain-containing protein [Nonomuraea sp. NPDC050310]|uniref:NUDIX hydrolase n=1 Tax=Nonomuraea sp. NPDC050310 TaxID=3154935 RepID=UPI0034043E79
MTDRAKPIREKALCYIVRDGRLLVFRHVDVPLEEAGVQVPAGGIEAGETPEEGALREAREETGPTELSIVRKLGVTDYDVTPYRWEIQRLHVFHLALHQETPERWASEERGGGAAIRLECFWIPLEQGHVLAGGQGALLSRLF